MLGGHFLDNIEEIIFSIIVHSGNAKSILNEALQHAQNNNFEEAFCLIEEANKELGKAHKIQTSIIQKESRGEKVHISILFVHAQDHLMTALSEKSLITNMINLYKEIYKLKSEREV